MSTTTIGNLLEKAERLTPGLRNYGAQITAEQWRCFDATTYRLLHELVGPERVGIREEILAHATVSRVLNG